MGVRLSTGLRNAILATSSFKGIFNNGVIRVFAGNQPASADDAEGSSPLLEITVSSGAFTPGSPDNALQFGDAAGGVMPKLSSQVWSGLGLLSGTAGWFRLYANDRTTGGSTTAPRLDGVCGAGSGQLKLASTAIVTGQTTTVDGFDVVTPAS